MKKRFLAGLMAAAVAAASLTTTASADLTADGYGTNAGGISSTSMTGTVEVGTIVLNLPTTINYVLNPYKLEYVVTAATEDAAAVTSTDQMVMRDLLVTNRGQVPVKVTAALEITATTGDMVVMTANNLSSRFTSGQKLAKMALLKGTASDETSTYNGTAFTVTQASTVQYPQGITAASISSWSSANPSTDFAPANVVSTGLTTTWDDSYYSVSFDLAKATVVAGATESDPSTYTSKAGALKVIADVNTDATWAGAGTETVTANIVWNIERNVV